MLVSNPLNKLQKVHGKIVEKVMENYVFDF
jgi:hypothetical protein